MKPINYIVRTIALLVLAGFLGYCSKDLLIRNLGKTDVPIDTERYVVPIKKNILKESLSQIGEVSLESEGMKLRLPSSAGNKIAADQIRKNNQSFGISISNEGDGDTLVLTMSKGPGSTILVPVPTFVALVDRGIIKASRK